MLPFCFIHARFPDPPSSKNKIITRLIAHRRGLLAATKGWARPFNVHGMPDTRGWSNLLEDIRLPLRDQRIIKSRAERISDRHAASTRLAHLRKDDAKKLEVRRHGVRLARVVSKHHADELATALHAEFPWIASATEAVWHAMRRSVRADDARLHVAPLLLDGPPSIGKSAWARALSDLGSGPIVGLEVAVSA